MLVFLFQVVWYIIGITLSTWRNIPGKWQDFIDMYLLKLLHNRLSTITKYHHQLVNIDGILVANFYVYSYTSHKVFVQNTELFTVVVWVKHPGNYSIIGIIIQFWNQVMRSAYRARKTMSDLGVWEVNWHAEQDRQLPLNQNFTVQWRPSTRINKRTFTVSA